MSSKRLGLYPKFEIKRTDGQSQPGKKHEKCDYFVLDLTHDQHAIPAIIAYSKSCRKDGFVKLADELDEKVLRKTTLTNS